MRLDQALRIIKPRRSDEAYLVLTLCCFYLQVGEVMPLELRKWLDEYLTSERRQIRPKRVLNMANLDVELKKTKKLKAETGRGKVTQTIFEFASRHGLDESTVKKWRRTDKFTAVCAIHDQLDSAIDKHLKGKKVG